jgi:nucleoside-diphosphate-sugar epimerase
MAYHRTRGLDVRIARIFNTYGPRMRFEDGRVVSNFIVQALDGVPLTVYGDGRQTRSFCYVDDLIEGLVRLSERSERASESATTSSACSLADLAVDGEAQALVRERRSTIPWRRRT